MYEGETEVKAVFLTSSKPDSLEIRGFHSKKICRNMQKRMLSKQMCVGLIELHGDTTYDRFPSSSPHLGL